MVNNCPSCEAYLKPNVTQCKCGWKLINRLGGGEKILKKCALPSCNISSPLYSFGGHFLCNHHYEKNHPDHFERRESEKIRTLEMAEKAKAAGMSIPEYCQQEIARMLPRMPTANKFGTTIKQILDKQNPHLAGVVK
jgi:hypothetical protein